MATFSNELVLPVQVGRDHIRGPETAPLTLLEYGDFESSHCAAASVIVDDIRRQMGDQLRFVYRHFPLVQIHPHAERAAEAAEAAGAQGDFWVMHDIIFVRQDALEDDDLLLYAADLGLDIARIAEALAKRVHLPRVREDFLSGVQSSVKGTPTFFINSVRHAGGYDAESLTTALERAAAVHPSIR
jgi:protein-disulfide isomerase